MPARNPNATDRPSPAPPCFDRLHAAHVAMLTGNLIDGAEAGPDGACYVRSETIPDPTLNFACGVRSAEQRDWAVDAARSRGREPAFLARDREEVRVLAGLLEPEAVFPASWMVAETAEAEPPEEAGALSCRATAHPDPTPPDSFCAVFGDLSDEPRIRDHLHRHYLPSLRAARDRADVAPLHIVVDDEAGPAACATLYLRDGLAGLYNVSTRANRQRRGLGAAVTAHALAQARERGAAQVFLQCPADGFVERLYARSGFRTVCSPSLVCLTAP